MPDQFDTDINLQNSNLMYEKGRVTLKQAFKILFI